MNVITQVVEQLLRADSVKATKYLAPNLVVRAVRKRYGNKIVDRGGRIEISLTIGRPNYVEREFIKLCQKAKEPFPIKKIQHKLYNPKPKKPSRK